MDAMNLSAEQEEKLNGEKAWLVEKADDIGRKATQSRDWKSQIRSMMELARDETEPEVVRHFLRYQAARNKKTWDKQEKVSVELDGLLAECQKKSGEDKALALALMQHLLCFCYRSYTHFLETKPS